MSLTLAEAQQQLSIVNSAISEYITGKRRKSLKVGTHEFLRAYDYVALTWKELVEERDKLQAYIDGLSTETVTPVFRKNTNFPLIVTKNPI